MVMYVVAIAGGCVADFLRQRKIATTIAVRKIWQGLGELWATHVYVHVYTTCTVFIVYSCNILSP